VIVTTGSASHPEELERIAAPAGRYCSSYQAELVALSLALLLLLHHDVRQGQRQGRCLGLTPLHIS
jgi:hypothetical protein